MRTITLGIGDLAAPAGSKDWAIAVRAHIQVAIKDTTSEQDSLQEWLRIMQKHRGYEALEDANGFPFKSYEAFCVEKKPYGLGYSPDALTQIVLERKSAAAVAAEEQKNKRPRGGQPGNKNRAKEKPTSNVDNVHIRKNRPDGNSQARGLRRLREQRPDLHALVLAEKLSVNSAMIQAGFRAPTITVRVDTPENALEPLKKMFGVSKLRAALDPEPKAYRVIDAQPGVMIDSGPIIPKAQCYNYGEDHWRELVNARRLFIRREVTDTFRSVRLFIREAEKMYKACGFASAEELIRDGYGIDPAVLPWMDEILSARVEAQK